MVAIRDARKQSRWDLVEKISVLLEQAAEKTGSNVAKTEVQFTRLEIATIRKERNKAQQLLTSIKNSVSLHQPSEARCNLLEAELLIHNKEWAKANKCLQLSQKLFGELRDLEGLSKAFIRQGYLLFLLGYLEPAADRFAQAVQLSYENSLDWAEAKARLIEIRIRLGWLKGLAEQIDEFWKITQNSSDIHHMAYANYAAGLWLLAQNHKEDAMARLRMTQVLAVTCGDFQLEAQSLENIGWIHFLNENWTEARQTQRRLIYFYQLRNRRDRRRVAVIRYRIASVFEGGGDKLWDMELQQLSQAFVHVQYWWWIFQLLHPANTEEQIREYWTQAQKVNQPRIWDLALEKVLRRIASQQRFAFLQDEISAEIQLRFQKK